MVQLLELPLTRYGQELHSGWEDVQPSGNVRHASDVHCRLKQVFEPVQLTSQAQALLHETLAHEREPMHDTWHLPSPHCTSWHESNVAHVMLHEAADWQSIVSRHAPCVSHAIVHA